MFKATKTQRSSTTRRLMTESLESCKLLTTVGQSIPDGQPVAPESPPACVRVEKWVHGDIAAVAGGAAGIEAGTAPSLERGQFDRAITGPGPGGGPNLLNPNVPRM